VGIGLHRHKVHGQDWQEVVDGMWDGGAMILQQLDQRIHNTAAPQQANGTWVLLRCNAIRPNASVLLAVTCHYVEPAVSSLDIHA
jgi:hypothetical protein